MRRGERSGKREVRKGGRKTAEKMKIRQYCIVNVALPYLF